MQLPGTRSTLHSSAPFKNRSIENETGFFSRLCYNIESHINGQAKPDTTFVELKRTRFCNIQDSSPLFLKIQRVRQTLLFT